MPWSIHDICHWASASYWIKQISSRQEGKCSASESGIFDPEESGSWSRISIFALNPKKSNGAVRRGKGSRYTNAARSLWLSREKSEPFIYGNEYRIQENPYPARAGGERSLVQEQTRRRWREAKSLQAVKTFQCEKLRMQKSMPRIQDFRPSLNHRSWCLSVWQKRWFPRHLRIQSCMIPCWQRKCTSKAEKKQWKMQRMGEVTEGIQTNVTVSETHDISHHPDLHIRSR